ncbi:MAG: hypothetical protein J6M62_11375 [Selenomonadaceae bacterium]|nr:hypothetical protein [Selenomonadaceae bacterium]
MINKEIFASRLRSMRLCHNLSGAVLADLLLFKNQSSIGNLEAGKSLPLLDATDRIADLFAVPVDWLIGRSRTESSLKKISHKKFNNEKELVDWGNNEAFDDIYNNYMYDRYIIEALEENLLKKANTFGNTKDIDSAYGIEEGSDVKPLAYFRLEVVRPLITIPSPYRDTQQRGKIYSLPVRANMIFAMKVFYHLSLRFYKLYKIEQADMNPDTLNNVIFPEFKKTKNGSALLDLAAKCRHFYSLFLSIGNDKKFIPPFYNLSAYIMDSGISNSTLSPFDYN